MIGASSLLKWKNINKMYIINFLIKLIKTKVPWQKIMSHYNTHVIDDSSKHEILQIHKSRCGVWTTVSLSLSAVSANISRRKWNVSFVSSAYSEVKTQLIELKLQVSQFSNHIRLKNSIIELWFHSWFEFKHFTRAFHSEIIKIS